MVFATSVLILGGCVRAGASGGFDSRGLVGSLEHILLWHQKNAPTLTAALQPGLSRPEIAKLASQHRMVLPEEVYALYGWRNGTRAQEPFFDVYRFVPLSEALEAGDLQGSPAYPDRLPIFQSVLSSDGYEVVCPRRPQGSLQAQAPVEFYVDGVPSPDMDNLTMFLGALAASFEQGVFTANEDGELDTNRPAFERILLDFRPQRKADVETVLRGQGASLTSKREMQAYQALTQTEHPRAEDLISKSMNRWLHQKGTGLTGLLLLAHLNTPGSLARLQEAARDPYPEIRREAFGMMAWQVQWADQRLDAATENAALVELGNVNPKLCDSRDIARVLRWSPNNRPLPSLIGLLGASSDGCSRDTRIAAAQSLGQLGDRSAVTPLLTRLRVETDMGAQTVLLAALADLGNAEGERQLRLRMEGMDRTSLWNFANDGGDGSGAERRIAGELLAHFKK